MTTAPDTQGGPLATSKDRLYAIRQPKRAFRHQQKLALDTITSEALIKVQHLEDLKTARNVFSRTVLIRRAVSLYRAGAHLIARHCCPIAPSSTTP